MAELNDPASPVATVSETAATVYEYYMRATVDGTTYYLSTDTQSEDAVTVTTDATDESALLKVKLIKNSDGTAYYIMQTNADGANYECISASEATSGKTLWYAHSTSSAAYYKVRTWTVTSVGTDDAPSYNITCPTNSELGWLPSTDVVKLGTASAWEFIPANDAAEKMTDTDYATAYQEAQDVLALVGVGYPKADAESRTTLQAVLDNADATSNDITAAITTYKSSLDDIQLPEDGKVYQIVAQYYKYGEQPLYWDSTKENSWGGTGRMGTKKEDCIDTNSSYFFCHEVDGKFLLVNNDGKYLVWLDTWYDSSSANNAAKCYNNNQTGGTDTYNSTYALWTIERANIAGADFDETNCETLSATNANFFGCLEMKATTPQGDQYLCPRYGGSDDTLSEFDSSSAGTKIYHAHWQHASDYATFAFKFVEIPVETYNALTLNKASEISEKAAGYSYIGTYSSPFPVTLPDGMVAYYAESYDGGESVTLTSVDGSNVILPENTGFVILGTENACKNGTKFNPVPATGDGASVTSVLQPTNGDEKTVDSATTAYVLGKPNSSSELGFFLLDPNDRTIPAYRAYLVSSSSTEAVKISFGESTGITTVASENQGNVNAPVFDLMGRRISTLSKGVYVKNGKKFIVK